MRTEMRHSRTASDEGWAMLVGVAFFSFMLGSIPFLFKMGALWTMIWGLIIGSVAGILVIYAILNIRSGGVFRSVLTDEEFSQTVPVRSCGESFKIKLSEITRIEIQESRADGDDQWYLHTSEGRYQISSNYGNPHRKIGEAIQRALPHIQTMKT